MKCDIEHHQQPTLGFPMQTMRSLLLRGKGAKDEPCSDHA